mgnify:CR=1 FL=1
MLRGEVASELVRGLELALELRVFTVGGLELRLLLRVRSLEGQKRRKIGTGSLSPPLPLPPLTVLVFSASGGRTSTGPHPGGAFHVRSPHAMAPHPPLITS